MRTPGGPGRSPGLGGAEHQTLREGAGLGNKNPPGGKRTAKVRPHRAGKLTLSQIRTA